MTEKTITQAELTAALSDPKAEWTFKNTGVLGLGAYGTGTALYPSAVAQFAFDHVTARREPEYVEGGHYVDADDEVFQFDIKWDGTKRWYGIAEDNPYDFEHPARPLRKLKLSA